MEILHTRTTSTDDSDAIVLTAGTNKLIEVLNVHVVYTSTATAGNRQLILRIQDENNTLVTDYHAGAVQAASNIYHYVFGRGVYRETSFVDDSIQCPFSWGTVLLPGWDLRVLEDNTVDAAADDMTVDVVYKEIDVTTGGNNVGSPII